MAKKRKPKPLSIPTRVMNMIEALERRLLKTEEALSRRLLNIEEGIERQEQESDSDGDDDNFEERCKDYVHKRISNLKLAGKDSKRLRKGADLGVLFTLAFVHREERAAEGSSDSDC